MPNPATNEVVTRVPQNTQAEMEQAVESAKAAFKGWSQTSPLKRQEIMFKYQNLVKENLVSRRPYISGREVAHEVFLPFRKRLRD